MGIYQHHRRHVPRYVVVWVVVIAAILGGGAALGALTVLAPAADATPPKHQKVTICHNGHPITVADDGYWGGHIHHPGDTLGACPAEPTEEPTWTPTASPTPSTEPTPEPSTSPTPITSPTPTMQPTLSPEPSASPTVAPSPSTSPVSPAPSTTPGTTTPVPSVTSSALPLPVLPTAGASSVPYTAPDKLAATGMSEATGAGIGLAAALLGIGTVLVLARRKAS